MVFKVTLDERSLKRSMKALEAVYPPAWVLHQVRRSMSVEVNRTHRSMVSKAGPITGLTGTELRRRIGKYVDKKRNPYGSVWVTKERSPIAASYWRLRQTKTGIRATGRKGAGVEEIHHGFRWTPENQTRAQVFRRRGKKRLPIDRVFVEPTVADALKKHGGREMKGANLRIFRHMRAALKKRGARQRR